MCRGGLSNLEPGSQNRYESRTWFYFRHPQENYDKRQSGPPPALPRFKPGVLAKWQSSFLGLQDGLSNLEPDSQNRYESRTGF